METNIRHVTISVDGEVAVHDEPLPYERMSALVEGYIEAVPLLDGTLWLNEEGKIGKGNGAGPPWPRNPVATVLCHVNQSIYPDDWIAGPVLITGGVDDEGETCGVSDELMAYLAKTHLLPPEENRESSRSPDGTRDSEILDDLSDWLCHPDPDGQWRSACDFIELVAELIETTGRPTDPTTPTN